MFTMMSILLSTYKYADLSFWGRLWYFIKTDPFVFLLGLLYCVICILVAWFSFKEDPLKDYRGGPAIQCIEIEGIVILSPASP